MIQVAVAGRANPRSVLISALITVVIGVHPDLRRVDQRAMTSNQPLRQRSGALDLHPALWRYQEHQLLVAFANRLAVADKLFERTTAERSDRKKQTCAEAVGIGCWIDHRRLVCDCSR